jgi:hypothetical protein
MPLIITKLVHHLPSGLPFPPSPTVRHTMRTLSPLRADIKNGAPRAIRLLYSIGKCRYHYSYAYLSKANHHIPDRSLSPLHQSELDRLYTSTVQSVQTYFDFFEQLHQIKEVGPETTQFVVLAMLLAFMAFVAQKLRQHCGSEWTQEELQQGRIALQMEINTIDAWDPSPIPKDGWALTLCGIVANSGPLTTFNDVKPWECTPLRPFREFPLQGPAVLTRDIRTPTPVPPCQETDFPARTMSPQSSTGLQLRCLRLGSVPGLLQSWTSAVLFDCLCLRLLPNRYSGGRTPSHLLRICLRPAQQLPHSSLLPTIPYRVHRPEHPTRRVRTLPT